VELDLPVTLPDLPPPTLDPDKPLLAYHPWGLDPTWRADDDAERWLLLEPALFARHPWSRDRLAWVLTTALVQRLLEERRAGRALMPRARPTETKTCAACGRPFANRGR
jgi:hypothetical protein